MAAPFSRTLRALREDGSQGAWWAWGMGAVLLAAWMSWFLLGQVSLHETSRKARIEVLQSAHVLAPTLSGRVAVSRLQIGRMVKAGEVLVELDARAERLRAQEEETRLQALPARIALLEREIDFLEQARGSGAHAAQAAAEAAQMRLREAGLSVDFAQEQQQRLQRESEEGGVARIEAQRAASEARKLAAARDALASDARRAQADAQSQSRQQQAQIENLRRTRAGLQAEMQGITATLARLRADQERYVLRAPVDGRIAEMAPLREGAVVGEGQKLASIVPGGELIAVADFAPAAVIGRVQVGQSARMRLDGFPWAQYGSLKARVSRVASEAREGLVRVEFALEPGVTPALAMQHGQPGMIEIRIEDTTPARLLLRAAGQQWAQGTSASNAALAAAPAQDAAR